MNGSVRNTSFARPILHGDVDNEPNNEQAKVYIESFSGRITPSSQTRSQQTVAAYQNRVRRQILPKVREEFFDDSPTSVMSWLISKSKSMRPATFRQYRAAIILHLESIVPADFAVTAEIEAIIFEIKKLKPPTRNKNLPPRTSSSKRRFIRHKELIRMVASLRTTRRWGNIAADYLMAAITTGLRPSEWGDIQVLPVHTKNEGIVIQVRNAKNTNERGTGELRWMFIPTPIDAHVSRYVETIQALRREGLTIEQINKGVGRIFTRTSKALFGEKVHITPYSARHQFSANAKNLYGAPQVAMLHGHRSETTAAKHYGKRTSGFKPYKIYYAENISALEKILNGDIMSE